MENTNESNIFAIFPKNPQDVMINNSIIVFENGNTYDLRNPDLSYFITNTILQKEIHDYRTFYNFLCDMKYDIKIWW